MALFSGIKSLVQNLPAAVSKIPTTVQDLGIRNQPVTNAASAIPTAVTTPAIDFSGYNPAAFKSDFSEMGIAIPTAANLAKVADIQAKIDAGQKIGSASQAYYDRFFPAYELVSSALKPTAAPITPVVTTALPTTSTATEPTGITSLVKTPAAPVPSTPVVPPTTTAAALAPVIEKPVQAPSPGITALPSNVIDPYNKISPKLEGLVQQALDQWQRTGKLSSSAESTLMKVGKDAGVDYLNQFRNYQTYAPTTVSEYVAPTTYTQDLSQVVGLTAPAEQKLDALVTKVRSGSDLTPDELIQLNKYLTKGNLGTYDEYFNKPFTPTATDLYANLTSTEEARLADLVQRASEGKFGSPQSPKSAGLEKLLRKAGLGTAATYFGRPTYTNVENYENLFRPGTIIGASASTTPTGEVTTGDIWNPSVDSYTAVDTLDQYKINKALKDWQQTGTLTYDQKNLLDKYGDKYDTDFLTQYSQFQTQATPVNDILQDFDRYARAGKNFEAAQYARSYGLDEAEIAALLQGYGTQKSYNRPVYTLEQLQNIFSKGTKEGDQAVMNYMTANLGTKDDVQVLADTLNSPYLTAVTNELNKTFGKELTATDTKALGDEVLKLGGNVDNPESIRALQTFIKDKYGINMNDSGVKNVAKYLNKNLQSADTIYDTYSYDNLKDMSAKQMEKFIENSAYNRLQEAGVLGGVLANVFGFDANDTKGILKDVMSSEAGSSDPEFRKIYNQLIKTNTLDNNLQNKVLATAARLAPDSKYWTNQYDNSGKLVHNGEMLYDVYSNPITEPITANANQYGSYNGIPMFNAALVKKGFKGDSDNVASFRDLDLRNIGWNIKGNQDYETFIKRGLDALGIDTTSGLVKNAVQNYDKLMSEAQQSGYANSVDPYQVVTEDGGVYNAYNDITKLQKIGQQLGVTDYSSMEDLYNKVDKAAKDLYLVVGETSGLFDTPKGKNHAAALLKEVGDKLVAIGDPQYFRYEKPKESWASKTFGSTIGGIVEGLASIPLMPEIALFASGGNAGLYAALKGAQVAGQPGSDVGDVLKTAGLAYLTSEIIPKTISPEITQGIASLPGISDLPAGWSTFVAKAGTNAVIASGIAGLTNRDIGDAFLNSLAVSTIKGAGSGLENAFKGSKIGDDFEKIKDEFTKTAEDLVKTNGDEQFSFKNIDPRFKDLVQNIVIDTMFFKKDLDRAVQDSITRMAMSGLKSTGKTKLPETTKEKVVYT